MLLMTEGPVDRVQKTWLGWAAGYYRGYVAEVQIVSEGESMCRCTEGAQGTVLKV